MRVVIDTNILVSFAIRPNPSFQKLFDHVRANGEFLVCDETLAEFADVLTRDKFRRYLPNIDDIIAYLEHYEAMSERVDITERVVACRDPGDDKFLSLAVSGRADCIVAGDSDLTGLGAIQGIPILTPTEFLARFVAA